MYRWTVKANARLRPPEKLTVPVKARSKDNGPSLMGKKYRLQQRQMNRRIRQLLDGRGRLPVKELQGNLPKNLLPCVHGTPGRDWGDEGAMAAILS